MSYSSFYSALINHLTAVLIGLFSFAVGTHLLASKFTHGFLLHPSSPFPSVFPLFEIQNGPVGSACGT